MAVATLKAALPVVALRKLHRAQLAMAPAETDLMKEKPKSNFDKSLDKMLSDAWGETKSDFSFGSPLDKITSTAKLLGKGTFFLGVKTVQNLPDIAKRAAEIQAKKAKK